MKHNEETMQANCVSWFDLQYPQYKKLLFHPANGGFRNIREASRLKKMGVRPGVADLILAIPKGNFGALAIEMKTDKGKQTEYQKEFQTAFIEVGNEYKICRSFEEFIRIINNYLNI